MNLTPHLAMHEGTTLEGVASSDLAKIQGTGPVVRRENKAQPPRQTCYATLYPQDPTYCTCTYVLTGGPLNPHPASVLGCGLNSLRNEWRELQEDDGSGDP